MARIEKFSPNTLLTMKAVTKVFEDLRDKWNKDSLKKVHLWYLSCKDGYYVTFTNLPENQLGFYKRIDRLEGEIVLSEKLLDGGVSFEVLKEVASHEFAHFIDDQLFGGTGHGESFKEVCKVLEIETDGATMKDSIYKVAKHSSVFEKVKKLLSLSESSNVYESQSALLKAKELMREYGLVRNLDTEERAIYRVVLVRYKSFTMELKVITQIAKEISNCWILHSIDSQGKLVYAHGTKTECEIASYLFDYLQRELNALLMKAKKDTGDNSKSFRTSFFYGVLDGFINRLREQERETKTTSLAKYRYENEKLAIELVYPNTSFRTMTQSNSVNSYSGLYSGRKAGRSLKIRNGISNSAASGTLRLA